MVTSNHIDGGNLLGLVLLEMNYCLETEIRDDKKNLLFAASLLNVAITGMEYDGNAFIVSSRFEQKL